MTPRLSRFAAAALTAAWLSACQSDRAPTGGAGTPPSVAGTPLGEFELAQRDKAQSAHRLGHGFDEAQAWEVLTVLRPSSAYYRERLGDARRRNADGAAEHLARAELLRKRGELDAARTQYLLSLSFDPEQSSAVDALRDLERERDLHNFSLRRPRGVAARNTAGASSAAAPAVVANTAQN